MCFSLPVKFHAELFQCQQSEFTAKVAESKFVVVAIILPFQFHGPQTHANPRIQLLEGPAACRKLRGEVICRSPDNSVQFRDDLGIEIVAANGDLPNLRLKFLH